MKMADRPAVVAEIWIGADPADVWALVTDVARMGEWSPENEGGRWIDGADGPAVGARFTAQNERRGVRWETTSTVTASDPVRRFAFAVHDPDDPAATWSFDLAPEDGGTRVAQRARLGPGPSGLQSAVDREPDREEEFVSRRMQSLWKAMHTTLEGIKAAAEGG